MLSFFIFGVLLDTDVRDIVIGRPVPPKDFEKAVLSGYRRVRIRSRVEPVLLPDPKGRVGGSVLNGLDETAAARLSYYEGGDYDAKLLPVEVVNGGPAEAWVFLPIRRPSVVGGEWNLEAWQQKFKRRSVLVAREWMAKLEVTELAVREAHWRKRSRR